MRNKLAAGAVLLAVVAARAAAAGVDLFPKPNEIFPLLLADPRHIQLSASYYRLDGANTADIALGHSWGLTRWRSGAMQDWLWESDVEGMAYSRFRIGGGVNQFETVDFFGNLPITARRGDVAFKGVLFHESSHLGDDYIRRTGDQGFRYSDEGLRAQSSLDVARFARVYGGGSYLLHAVPDVGRWALQNGFELTSDDLRLSKEAPARLFLAQDFQWHQAVGWNMDSRTMIGLKIGIRESPTRAMRVQLGYFEGHSPFGQFYSQRARYADVSIAFEL